MYIRLRSQAEIKIIPAGYLFSPGKPVKLLLNDTEELVCILILILLPVGLKCPQECILEGNECWIFRWRPTIFLIIIEFVEVFWVFVIFKLIVNLL